MQFIAKVTKSGIARTLGAALIMAAVVGTTGMILADNSYGPTYSVTVRVFEGDPRNDIRLSGMEVLLVADDRSNPSHGLRGFTDSNGEVTFDANEGGYNFEIAHNIESHYGRDYYTYIDGNTRLDASLIRKEGGGGVDSGNGCLPNPPRGKPLLNIWAISESGANCTDYPLLAAKNVTQGSGYGHAGSANEGDIVRVRLYVHNGTMDYPENEASNVMVAAGIPSGSSGQITASAWASNADLITSAQKGGNVSFTLASGLFLEYIPGSAQVYGRGPVLLGGLSDSVVGSGASLGNMRGCYEFLRFVTFELRVKRTAPPVSQTLTVVKQVDNTGGGTLGPNDFGLAVNGNAVNSGQAYPVPAGTYTVTEIQKSNYTFVGFSGDCNSNGQVTVGAGQNKTCVLTNRFNVSQPPVGVPRIDKTVRNVTANQSNWTDSTNANPGDTVEFRLVVTSLNGVNEHVVVYDDLPSRLTFIDGTVRLDGNPVQSNNNTLALGTMAEGAVRTITFRALTAAAAQFDCNVVTTLINSARVTSNSGEHSDIASVLVSKVCVQQQPASITVVKEVDNTGGGTLGPNDFELFINNQRVTHNIANTLQPGSYVVRENQRTGYNLVGMRGDCDANGSITLAAGQNKTCIITNRFIPTQQPATLTVIKEVDNTGGGTLTPADFELFVNGNRVTHNQAVTLAAGTYTVSETRKANYELVGIRGACGSNGVVTLSAGQNATCVITNRYAVTPPQQATITVVKEVDNTGGGTLGPNDFELFVGNQRVSHNTAAIFQPGTYVIRETQRTGYSLAGMRGGCDANGSLTLASGENKICVITNRYAITPPQQATITVVKEVDNTGGGTLGPNDFELFVGAQRVTHNTSITLAPGTYTVRENQRSNYQTTGFGGACNASGNVTLSAGSSATCIIRNRFTPTAGITLSKRAFNQTLNRDAAAAIAGSNNIIVYTLKAQNTGNTAIAHTFADDITDILQLAEIIHFGGGNLETSTVNGMPTYRMVWPSVNIAAGTAAEKTFTVQVKSSLPTNSDFVMTNVYGNIVNVQVRRPQVAGAFIAPPTGPAAVVSAGLALLTMAGFIVYRKRESLQEMLSSK